MSLMLPGEYGTVREDLVDMFRDYTFEFFVTGVKVVANDSQRMGRRDLFLCLEVDSVNPVLMKGLLGMTVDDTYKP